jgi:CBS domain-containing protein
MKWMVTSVMEFPVVTVVEAETEEEAVAISRKRLPVSGDQDEHVGWILDERFFNPNGSRAEN